MTINHRPAGSPASNQYGTFTVRYASPAQQRIIAKLLDERDHTLGALDPATVNVQNASSIIDQLLAFPIRADKVVYASDKQRAFITSLRESKVNGGIIVDEALAKLGIPLDKVTSQQARNLIDRLLSAPSIPKSVKVEVGAYMHKGVVYSVRRGTQSGNLNAFQWNGDAWVYAGAVKYAIEPSERLSLMDAMNFGAGTGVCVHCGRTLTDPDSVRFGIGSTCRKKYN